MAAMQDTFVAASVPEAISISVVVPTRNRPESVVHAVQSALNQSHAPHEVIVVIDGPDPATIEALEGVGDRRVIAVELSENGGAARARNIGVTKSTGDWVAFLDDDDEWHPGKLRAQAAAVATSSNVDRLILATGFERKADGPSDWWPLRPPSAGERVSDYLFVRRHPGEGMLLTSTIMLPREFAEACPLREHLPVHEEWDWFIELEKAGGRFSVVMEPLVVYNAPTARISVSTDARWETSLAWGLLRRRDMSRRAFSDFCLTEVARLSRNSGGVRTAIAVLLVASTGSLSLFSVARYLAISMLPGAVRRRMAARRQPKAM